MSYQRVHSNRVQQMQSGNEKAGSRGQGVPRKGQAQQQPRGQWSQEGRQRQVQLTREERSNGWQHPWVHPVPSATRLQQQWQVPPHTVAQQSHMPAAHQLGAWLHNYPVSSSKC